MSFEVEKNRRGANIQFSPLNEFENASDFEAWFATEKKKWKKGCVKNLNQFCTENYVCQYSRKKNYHCHMKLRIRKPQDSLKVYVELTVGRHNHKEIGRVSLSARDKSLMLNELDTAPAIIQNKIQRASMSLQADATYKLTWHGFPLLVCGFSDAKHKFFGTFIALCSNENKWSYEHFFRAISKNDYEAKVLMADGDKTISAAALLLNTEWENRFANKPEVQDICRYFFRQWINSLCGWYEGFSLYAATNNGLESRNAFLKKITFRQKLGLTDFLHMAENTIANWSTRPEEQIPCQEPEIGPAVYREAYLLKLKNPLCKKVTGQNIYVLTLQELSENDMLQMYSELAENTFACWQRYKQIRASIMIIKKSNVWPSMYMCSCSTGRKKRVCEHSVLLMCKLKILVYPPDASAKPLSRKRKLGRPKLAGRALSRE
ncbi:MULE transposase domain-containing protein [Ditylenchus destructor]|nr:MULE transposase domain-containing protein [Ditylenchus destructor]